MTYHGIKTNYTKTFIIFFPAKKRSDIMVQSYLAPKYQFHGVQGLVNNQEYVYSDESNGSGSLPKDVYSDESNGSGSQSDDAYSDESNGSGSLPENVYGDESNDSGSQPDDVNSDESNDSGSQPEDESNDSGSQSDDAYSESYDYSRLDDLDVLTDEPNDYRGPLPGKIEFQYKQILKIARDMITADLNLTVCIF